jgi:hypothetical protein
MLDDSTLHKIMLVELGCEFMLGAPSFIVNIYTAIRISQIATFNVNLKIVLNTISLSTAFTAIVHPIINAVPRESFSIAKGNYKAVAVVYFLHYIHHSFTIVATLKFIIVAIERRFAFRKRRIYEHGRGTIGRNIAVGTVRFSGLI